MESIGNEVNQVVVFNSGYLTVDGELMADLSNISISNSFEVKAIKSLNSIKKRTLRRANLEQSISATMIAIHTAIYKIFHSSSSPVSGGTEWTVKDGQQNSSTIWLTCRRDDDATKEIQYQLVNPIIATNNVNLPLEEFANTEVEIMCTEIILVTDTAAEN